MEDLSLSTRDVLFGCVEAEEEDGLDEVTVAQPRGVDLLTLLGASRVG